MKKRLIKYSLLVITLFLVACGKEPEYTYVIPQDVDLVATIDFQKIYRESSFYNTEDDEIKKVYESLFTNSTSVKAKKIEKLLEHPDEVGIDWTQKSYFFIPKNSSNHVLVLPVSDPEKLKSSLLTLVGTKIKGKKFIKYDNVDWASGRLFNVAINDQVCLIICNQNKVKDDDLKQSVTAWLSQTKEVSFISSKYYDKLLDQKGEIGLFAGIDALHENLSMIFSLIYSEDMDRSSVKYFAGISCQKGNIRVEGTIQCEDEKMQDWLSKQAKACKKLKGSSLLFLPKNTPLWVAAGLKGEHLFKCLAEHPSYGKQIQNLNIPFDLEGVIDSMDGDFAIVYPNGLFIDVDNDEILRICVATLRTMGRFIGLDIQEESKNQYNLIDNQTKISKWLGLPEDRFLMGMNHKFFYLTTNEAMSNQLSKEESLASTPWATQVDDNLLFAAFNFHEGEKLFEKSAVSHKTIKVLQKYFSYLTYSQEDIETNAIELSFVDQDRNTIEQLLELFIHGFNY